MNRCRIAVPWLLVTPVVAFAHHSGLYDEASVVSIDGTITSIAWANPHVLLTVETTTDDGRKESWEVEGTSVNALQRWGIDRNRFRVGDHIGVTGPKSRYGRNAMIGATTRLPDGEQVVLWPNVAARLGLADSGINGLFPPPANPAPAPAHAQGIFRVWTPRGRPAANPDELPLTERAREAARAYNPLEDDPALRCIAPGMPVMLDTPYPIEFVDEGDRIIMRFEEWDGVRTIYMKPGAGPRVQEPSPQGVSFGRWEGRTLAIFTTYISYPYFDDLGTPQSGSVTVLERYTPSDNEQRLDWQVTVTDPTTFTTPVVRTGFMTWEPGEEIKPYNCTLPER